MTFTQTPGALKKFRRTPWRFQQTVDLPMPEEREKFVSTILTAVDGFESATVTIDEVIFNTKRLALLCPTGSKITHDTSISAPSVEEARGLLVAAFWDGYDFICIPTPKPFVIYADHDDWITFYANSKSNLNRVIAPLAASGYKLIPNWQREL